MPLNYNKDLIPRAKKLRSEMTPQEKHLWYDFLSRYPVRFQRQKTIDNFIVDFYCHKAKLVIELDGLQHGDEDKAKYDAERTFILKKYQLEVLRFANLEINKEFAAVCVAIDNAVNQKIHRK